MLEEAKLALERTTIVSPITGRFSERRVDLHQFVNANADVGGIIDLQKMQIETRISSDDFSWLMLSEPERQKKQVTITLLSPAHETPLMGHVSRVGATLDPTTRTHSLYVEITNSIADIISGVSVTPGTFCKMKFEGKTVKNILSLPFVSVKNNQVQVVRDGKLQVLPIEPIRFEGNRFLVQGDFKKEDQIIPSFRDNLTVGEAILTALQKGTRK
jgi:multidrug efflux pump subunit AcrA (membrane-fusion protein)